MAAGRCSRRPTGLPRRPDEHRRHRRPCGGHARRARSGRSRHPIAARRLAGRGQRRPRGQGGPPKG
eukprot:9415277-Alexandrium_andersonii.AAC.1